MISAVLFLSLVSKVLSVPPVCNEGCANNEVFTPCHPGQFQATCWNRNPSFLFGSFGSCEPGCVCKRGFVRHPETFACIATKDCPPAPLDSKACPTNEKWSECGHGCDEVCGFFPNRDFICRSCVEGCVCQEGYVRSLMTGQCVESKSCTVCSSGYSIDPDTEQCAYCHPVCPVNEFWNPCGSRCAKNCENPNGSDLACAAVCNPQCDCVEGYLRNAITKRCIPKVLCPDLTVFCPRNQVYKECGSKCERTCPLLSNSTVCTTQCVKGCFCKPGFVRNAQRDCVAPTAC